MNSKQKIIFFDGYCGLCDRAVTQIFLKDKKHVFYFAPLLGLTARQVFAESPQMDSILYWKDGKVLTKSQAILEILHDLGGIYSFFRIFKLIPLKIRDAVYDYVARNRYGWFGQSETCRLPSLDEKAYFLD